MRSPTPPGVQAPARPRASTASPLGHYASAGTASAVCVVGNVAYLADQDNGLVCLDVRDPSQPRLLGQNTNLKAYGVTVHGGVAYVADNDAGLVTLNITDPATPTKLDSFATGGTAMDVSVAGNVAYVADGANDLVLVNVTDPTALSEIKDTTHAGSAWDVDVSGNVAYVAAGTELLSLNVTDTPSASALGSCATGYGADMVKGIDVEGDLAFVSGTSSGLVVVNISDPEHPVVASSYVTPGTAEDVVVSGNVAFVADSANGVVALDVRDPSAPAPIATFDTAGTASRLFLAGDVLYVADQANGLVTLQVSEATSPTLLDVLAPPSSNRVTGMTVTGDVAYLLNDVYELVCINVTDPTAMTTLGEAPMGFGYSIDVEGNWAYVVGSGLRVYNVTDPRNPALQTTYAPSGLFNFPQEIHVEGDVAYIADRDNGLLMINVTDPTAPTQLGQFQDAQTIKVRGLDVTGDVVYLTDLDDGLTVVNVSDPTAPYVLSYFDDFNSDECVTVAAAGNVTYVASMDGVVTSIDMTDMANPTKLDFDVLWGQVKHADLSGDLLAVARTYYGVSLYDVSDPTNLRLLGTYDESAGNGVYALQFAGNIVYAADYERGLLSVKVRAGGIDDGDGDGLSYLAEVFEHGTDPGDDDTDDDTYTDDAELFGGTDPTDPEDPPDLTPPSVSWIDPLASVYATPELQLNLSVTDIRHAIDAVVVEVDGQANYSATHDSGTTYRLTRTFAEGTHDLRVHANDSVGNMNSTVTATVTIDTTGPTVTVVSPAAGYSRTATVTVTLIGDASSYWYQIVGVDGANQTYTAPVDRVLPDGTYTLRAYGNDSVGNEAIVQRTFTVDTVAPAVTITGPAATTLATSTVTISLGGNASTYWYSLAGVDVTNQTYAAPTQRVLPDGTYTLRAYGNDSAGNVAMAQRSFSIDTTPPNVTILSPAATNYTASTVNVSLGGDAAAYWYYIAGVDATNHTWTSIVNRTLANGEYILHAFGNDTVGNLNATQRVTFVVAVPEAGPGTGNDTGDDGGNIGIGPLVVIAGALLGTGVLVGMYKRRWRRCDRIPA